MTTETKTHAALTAKLAADGLTLGETLTASAVSAEKNADGSAKATVWMEGGRVWIERASRWA